jgi:lysyl-tRNA synthetase class 2
MTSRYDEIFQTRVRKLADLRSHGIDPYPARVHRSHTNQQAIADFTSWEAAGASGEMPSVRVAGRITAMRTMGKATFLDLRDGTGRLQVYVRRDHVGDAAYELLADLDLGDFIAVDGPLFRTRTNEITVDARRFTILAKALLPPPEKWHGLQDVEIRYRQRYLDLMANEDVRRIFLLRSQIVAAIRRFMDRRGFIEVETPVLQPEPGGAAARPFVTHHNALDRDLYLRVALELHLKRLIVGGFDKVYEIGRIFRNEGIDTKHNPEFTMMESYEAYADYHDVAAMVEEMVYGVAMEVLGTPRVVFESWEIDFTPPWQRITMRDALIQYAGIDFERYRDEAALRAKMRQMGLAAPDNLGWGKLVDELVDTFVEPKLIQPTFLMDYPVELSPLAKRKPENPSLVERFEPFAAGFEFGNAYSELNDPIDQEERFREQIRLKAAGDEEAEMLDDDFLTALQHGMPPTGGLGIGIDRLVMLLTGQRSIREVILFPQLRAVRSTE